MNTAFALMGISALLVGQLPSTPLVPFEKEGRWGFTNPLRTKVVLEPAFEAAGPFSQGLAPVKKGGRYGYIDMNGQMKIQPQFEGAGLFSFGFAQVRRGEKYGYIDRTGQLKIEYRFDDAGPMREGRAPVKLEGRYGYIDQGGRIVIQPRFEAAGPFYEKRAAVRVEGRYGYIDPDGELRIRPRFEKAGNFTGGLAPVQIEGKWGYINAQGEMIITPRYDMAYPFSSVAEVAAVKIDGKHGYVAKSGEYAVKPMFDAVGKFFGTNAVGRVDGKTVVFLAEKKSKETKEVKILMEVVVANWQTAVKFLSTPPQATIYLISLWDWDLKTDQNRDTLLTDDRILPDGPTNLTAPVDRDAVWMVGFVRNGQKLYRKLNPNSNNKVEVDFK